MKKKTFPFVKISDAVQTKKTSAITAKNNLPGLSDRDLKRDLHCFQFKKQILKVNFDLVQVRSTSLVQNDINAVRGIVRRNCSEQARQGLALTATNPKDLCLCFKVRSALDLKCVGSNFESSQKKVRRRFDCQITKLFPVKVTVQVNNGSENQANYWAW